MSDTSTRSSDETLHNEKPCDQVAPRWANTKHKKISKSSLMKSILSASTTILMLLAAFLAGALFGSRGGTSTSNFQGTTSGVVPQVPLDKTIKTFALNPAFTQKPVKGEKEAAWDSLMPNGLGYISSSSISTPSNSNMSVIAVFHQLHCLYTLRRAYYAATNPESDGTLEDFDFERDRSQHTEHCFEYLRQSLMCSADSSIEPASKHSEGFLGWDVTRQCHDYDQLKVWTEQRRAFYGHGFLETNVHVEK